MGTGEHFNNNVISQQAIDFVPKYSKNKININNLYQLGHEENK